MKPSTDWVIVSIQLCLEKQASNEGITATKQIQIEQQTRLLIIDEDREFINTLVVEATTWGMQTAIVANPQQALEAIGRVRPDIVLLDMSVPNTRKDGLIFKEELSKQTPPIAVLVLTTNTQVTDEVAMSFDKPFSLERGIPDHSAVLPRSRLHSSGSRLLRETHRPKNSVRNHYPNPQKSKGSGS